MIKEGFSLIGLFGGIVLGIKYNNWVYRFIKIQVHHPLLRKILGFLIIFFAFLLSMTLIGNILHKLFKALALSTIDRILGFFLGATEGFLLAGFLIYILARVPVLEPVMTKGEVARYILSIFGEVINKV